MHIEQSEVALASARLATTIDASRVSVRAWIGDPPAPTAGRPSPAARASFSAGALAVQAAITAAAARPAASQSSATTGNEPAVEPADDVTISDPKLRALLILIERLTGHKVRLLHLDRLRGDARALQAVEQASSGRENAQPPARLGWGAELNTETMHAETEQTDFEATGTVTTADGRTISFDLRLGMAREDVEHSSSRLLLGDAARRIDPLMLSLDGGPIGLSDSRSSFDVNADGTTETVARAASGSAFLARDLNGNGAIDGGKELFGPATGDGFAELAALDSDANGWIDAADPVFAELRLWTGAPGASGTSLAESGVGAIFTGSVASLFELHGAAGQDLGGLTASGVYLTANGVARAAGDVDLTA